MLNLLPPDSFDEPINLSDIPAPPNAMAFWIIAVMVSLYLAALFCAITFVPQKIKPSNHHYDFKTATVSPFDDFDALDASGNIDKWLTRKPERCLEFPPLQIFCI